MSAHSDGEGAAFIAACVCVFLIIIIVVMLATTTKNRDAVKLSSVRHDIAVIRKSVPKDCRIWAKVDPSASGHYRVIVRCPQ